MIGTVLGQRYRVVHKIGEGATSEIYLAEHVHLGRREAIKVLKPELAAEPTFVSRFRREARAINRVQHSNIIGIYDFGQLADGRLYLAMEHANGRSVDHLLREAGPMPLARVLHIVHQLAIAVDHAHAHGVVHRDLKPANLVLVEHRGHHDVLKVLDFGMAKIVISDDGEELTRQGQIFGTPEYMAPEQVSGMAADLRSDIYAIGCITYELLVGRPPFRGTRVQLLHAHLEAAPPVPSAEVPTAAIPAALDELIARCLAKDPAARFQTGKQLAAALEQVPGFAERKTLGRAARIGHSVTMPAVHGPAENTFDSTPHMAVQELRDRMGTADTDSAHTVDVRDQLFAALMTLAEQMIDLDVDDEAILLEVAKIRGLRDDMARFESERVALEDRELRVEQSARQREGSLRFAVGDLAFDLQRAQPERRVDLEFQIQQLQQRLTELLTEAERELDAITDEGIELAAAEATLDDGWADAHGDLLVAVRTSLANADPAEPIIMQLQLRAQAIADAMAQLAGL